MNLVALNSDELLTLRERIGDELKRRKRSRHYVTSPLKTHCKHGHAYTDDNTFFCKRGTRVCRQCNARRSKEYLMRRKSS